MRRALLTLVCLQACSQLAPGLGHAPYITSSAEPGSFRLADAQQAASFYLDPAEDPGVRHAANDLRNDIERITGRAPGPIQGEAQPGATPVLIGTLGRSAVVDRLAKEGRIDVSRIRGQWESFLIAVVADPLPGVERALVIAGSDRRGTIFGIYDVSEQAGVSPWYWWADVPVPHREALFVKAGRYIEGPPAVKYRGIFINDEAPDLTGWAHEKFGDYNHGFYTNVFQLLLRLKANYLWPAMWNNCFNEDDPLNPKLADEYGIVMGTSHVEPMMRADKEWNRAGFNASQWNYDKFPAELQKFWREGIDRNKPYENVVTIAMRGKIDTPMSESANIDLLERIVAAQRKIIEEVMHTNAAAVTQDWALYKEVQEYYEKGMRVPDDVTLLWCDDNWGNVRRLPTAEERHRSGGAGIYYHFDYVGGPRNYKWVNTVPNSRIWEQMNLAYRYGADRIWIVNVGHLLHVDLPMEFFLTYAWSPDQWPKERIPEFTRLWAEREFGPAYAAQIADIVTRYTQYSGRRKPELLDPGTFSLVDYQEADRVLAEWKSIADQAGSIGEKLPADKRDAFFELVLYPIKACEIVNELYITVARNRLYAAQGRAGAVDLAAQARALFQADADLSAYYNHQLAGGKWNHMMDQTHIGYTSWQQPNHNIMPKVEELAVPAPGALGVAVEGSASSWPGPSGEAILPQFDVFNQPRHFIDVFNRGQEPFEFELSADQPWVVLSTARGKADKDQRVWAEVDWSKAPAGNAVAHVRVSGTGTNTLVKIVATNPSEPARTALKGFVEADGYVSIEAEHFTRNVPSSSARWEIIPDDGRTLSSLTVFPVTAESVTPPEGSPHLEYGMYLFQTGRVQVNSIIAPTLNFVPSRGLRFAVSFDDEAPQIVTAVPKGFFVDNGVRDWEESVRNNCRMLTSTHTIAKAGYHTLKFWMVDPAVALQKIVVNTGGLKPSYLGPPESFHATAP